jgi:hypothetical protein
LYERNRESRVGGKKDAQAQQHRKIDTREDGWFKLYFFLIKHFITTTPRVACLKV